MLSIKEKEDANNQSESEAAKAKHKKERDRNRSVFFCIGQSKIWGIPISKRIKRLRNKYGLTWLRTSMSFHKFPSLGQKFNSDLNNKVMDGIIDGDLPDRKCNCNVKSKTEEGTCFYGGKCRKQMVVYENECLLCNASNVGKTQRHLKQRTGEHVRDVWKVIETGRKKFGDDWHGSGGYTRADAFAKHFAQHCRDEPNSNAVKAKMKKTMRTTIVWQGDRIKMMKSSRTPQCKLCMMERKEILCRMRADPSKIINDNSDICASCKCRSRFHKFNRIEPTLRKRMTQKKVSSNRKSKQNRRKRVSNISSLKYCQPVTPSTPVTPEAETPPPTPLPVDTNIPGLPYESPTLHPTRLQLDRLVAWRDIQSRQPPMEV